MPFISSLQNQSKSAHRRGNPVNAIPWILMMEAGKMSLLAFPASDQN
jgi:hypothetical protein